MPTFLSSSSFRHPLRHPEGGTTETRPNVPFGTGGNLLSISLPLRQKGAVDYSRGFPPAGRAGLLLRRRNDEESKGRRNDGVISMNDVVLGFFYLRFGFARLPAGQVCDLALDICDLIFLIRLPPPASPIVIPKEERLRNLLGIILPFRQKWVQSFIVGDSSSLRSSE